MLQFSKINDAWDIKPKEIYKKKINDNMNDNENTCNTFEHVLNCEKCLEKLRKKLNFTNNINTLNEIKEEKENIIPQKNIKIQENFINDIKDNNIQDNNLEDFTNIINTKLLKQKINNFMNRNKDFKQLIIVVLIFIVSVLLIQSFRKPIEFDGLNKKIFIYPEELVKIKSLLK
jgi:hypothetical protein